jgi:hypothetical protein
MSGESVNALFGLFGTNLLDTAVCVFAERHDPLIAESTRGAPRGSLPVLPGD